MQQIGTRNSLLTLVAATAAAAVGVQFPGIKTKPAKKYPQPPCSEPEVIAAWNKEVAARGDRFSRIANRRHELGMKKQFADKGQHPKFAKERAHKQHKHPLRDALGAYTLTGSPDPITGKRRMWVAGVSAQS